MPSHNLLLMSYLTTMLSKGEGLIDQQYIVNDDSFLHIFGASWHAQSFTPDANHDLTTVRLLLNKEGSPGIMTVSIRAHSVDKPTGSDLQLAGTRDLDVLDIATTQKWIDFDLTAVAVTAATKFWIIVRTAGVDTDNDGQWRADITSPTYSGGGSSVSADSGVTWSAEDTSVDKLFKEGTQ